MRDGQFAFRRAKNTLLPTNTMFAFLAEEDKASSLRMTENDASADPNPFSKFVALDASSVKDYVSHFPSLSKILGGHQTAWKSRETGDGNINYVYILEGPEGALVVKQALPYIRCVGKDWPLTQASLLIFRSIQCILQDRVRIEAKWMMGQHKICPEHVPYVHSTDETMSLIAMEYLAPPFKTLRAGILDGEIYPKMATQTAAFLSGSLFWTSALALKAEVYRNKITELSNPEMCKATEQVIFMDAYYEAPTNAYLKPELEEEAAELRADVEAKLAVGCLRQLFLSKPEALIHADFHTGSVMVTKEAFYVIDGEFAFYGPMSFDVGKFIGNLFLTYYALEGHTSEEHPRGDQQQWLLDSAIEVWEGFKSGFLKLWEKHAGEGDAYPHALIDHPSEAFQRIRDDYMGTLFSEVLGFAGACMIRRIITIAQIDDYKSIKDRNVRATCSRRALKLGRRLLVQNKNREVFPDMHSVVRLAKELNV